MLDFLSQGTQRFFILRIQNLKEYSLISAIVICQISVNLARARERFLFVFAFVLLVAMTVIIEMHATRIKDFGYCLGTWIK